MRYSYNKLVVLACASLLAGCGGGGSSNDELMATPPTTGSLSVGMTDAAVDDVAAVNLRVVALELRQQNASDTLTIDLTDEDGNAMQFNLLDYQNGEIFPLFDSEEVPAGTYDQVRLVLEAPAQTPRECDGQDPLAGSHVEELLGGLAPIYVPSGSNTGLKIVSPFSVPPGGDTQLIIDFDLRQALHRPPPFDCYFLRPAYRIEAVSITGRIRGTVDSTLLDGSNALCSDSDPITGNAVYVYDGADRTPDDIDGLDGDPADPVATAAVEFDPNAGNTGLGSYVVAFLPPGDYTIAFTCRADQERLPNPESEVEDEQLADDALDFQHPQNVTVDPQVESVVDFPPAE